MPAVHLKGAVELRISREFQIITVTRPVSAFHRKPGARTPYVFLSLFAQLPSLRLSWCCFQLLLSSSLLLLLVVLLVATPYFPCLGDLASERSQNYYGEAVREQRRQGVWQGCCGDWADSGSHSLQSASGAPGRWGPRTLQLLNHIKCPALPYTCPAAATAEHTTQFGRSVHTPMHNLLHSRTAHPAEPTKVVELLPPSHHCCVHL